jgi:Flp pilus assembly pilin Flp
MRRGSHRDLGATAVEYGLLIALVIGIALAAIVLFGQKVFELFSTAPVF